MWNRAAWVFPDEVESGPEGRNDDLDIVAVFTHQLTGREQDMLQVLPVGLVALVDNAVCGGVLEMALRVMRLCLADRNETAQQADGFQECTARFAKKFTGVHGNAPAVRWIFLSV
jgi:hypothetical protein